ncbi:MAG: glycosyltransferase [Desulfurivibrio sp.]|nr:glycosyltransferase [Desulfurivibrio sp.]
MTSISRLPTPPSTPADLRIVVFSDSFRHRNGVGAYYCDLIDHLRARVAAITLVCPGETPHGKQQGLSLPLPGDHSQKLCLPGILKAHAVVKRLQPHVIIAASPGPYGILAATLARLFQCRFCFGYHTQYDQLTSLYWNRICGTLGKRYLSWLDRRFFSRSDAVFTNGRHMVDTAQQMGARRIELIGTPIDPLLLTAPVPIAPRKLGPILFVGRLAPEKNIPLIIDAAKALPHLRFILAGDGPLAKMVRHAAGELQNLEYVGWVNREKLLELLDHHCEVLLLPSQVESFGTVAAEAMARQRLAVVSDHCGIVTWPELADGLEVVPVNTPLAPILAKLAQKPPEIRAEKRQIALESCVRFNEKTITDWRNALFDITST